MRYRSIMAAALAALVVGFPIVVKDPYVMHMLNMAGIYALLTLSLNILAGFTGQVSLGHAAFYGIGAYTSAILSVDYHWSPWVGLAMAGVVAAAFGFLLGLPTLRLKGLYLAVATIGFGEIMYLVFVNWIPVTKGPMGITQVPQPAMLGIKLDSYNSYYYLVMAALVVALFLSYRLVNSRVGRALLAIRENETAAEAMGINSTYYKVLAFTLSAGLAGIAGGLYAHEIGFISPESFLNSESIAILTMMVAGGIGNIFGSVLGAVVLVVVPEMMRAFGDVRLVIYGAGLILMMIFLPGGLAGLFQRLDEYVTARFARVNSRMKEV